MTFRPTQRHNELRAYILSFQHDHQGIPPTIRQICKALEMSQSTTFFHLRRLVEAGQLIRISGHYAVPGTWQPLEPIADGHAQTPAG